MNKTQKSACYGVLLSLLLAGIVVFDFLDTRGGWPMMLLVGIIWGSLLLGPVYLLGRKGRPLGSTSMNVTGKSSREPCWRALLCWPSCQAWHLSQRFLSSIWEAPLPSRWMGSRL